MYKDVTAANLPQQANLCAVVEEFEENGGQNVG